MFNDFPTHMRSNYYTKITTYKTEAARMATTTTKLVSRHLSPVTSQHWWVSMRMFWNKFTRTYACSLWVRSREPPLMFTLRRNRPLRSHRGTAAASLANNDSLWFRALERSAWTPSPSRSPLGRYKHTHHRAAGTRPVPGKSYCCRRK